MARKVWLDRPKPVIQKVPQLELDMTQISQVDIGS